MSEDTNEIALPNRGNTLASSIQNRETASAPRLISSDLPGVVVNAAACSELALWVKSHDIPIDREDRPFKGLSARQTGNFYLLLVAICHQTSPRGKPGVEGTVDGLHLRGWDYLSAKLATAARQDREILSPGFWARITAAQVSEIFRDPACGARLSQPERRAQLIQDVGRRMLQKGWKHAYRMYELSEGRIATGPRPLLGLLGEFRAYDDPVHKKSYFFLALMRNSGLWKYADPERLGAPIDYHEIRGHLRLGTVQVHDPELRATLLAGGEVTAEQDAGIRRAVLKALMRVSEESGLRNPSQLHYLFWNVFRSCCTREQPHCNSCPATCALPGRYVPLALHPGGLRRCPLAAICPSAGHEPKFLDYQFDTDYY